MNNLIEKLDHIMDGLDNQIGNAKLRDDFYDAGYLGAIRSNVKEIKEKLAYESDLNGSDIQSLKDAGFETIGEIISAYNVAQSRLQAAESKLEEMANKEAEPISYEQIIDHEWVKISKTRFEQLEGCSWIQKRELYLHPQVQSNADKEIEPVVYRIFDYEGGYYYRDEIDPNYNGIAEPLYLGPQDRTLDKPARVGARVFMTGAKESKVIIAAQNQYEAYPKKEIPADAVCFRNIIDDNNSAITSIWRYNK